MTAGAPIRTTYSPLRKSFPGARAVASVALIDILRSRSINILRSRSCDHLGAAPGPALEDPFDARHRLQHSSHSRRVLRGAEHLHLGPGVDGEEGGHPVGTERPHAMHALDRGRAPVHER